MTSCAFFWENPKTDLWSQIIWILHYQKTKDPKKYYLPRQRIFPKRRTLFSACAQPSGGEYRGRIETHRAGDWACPTTGRLLQVFLRCLKYAGAPLLNVVVQTAMVYTAISVGVGVSVYVRRSGRLRELITLDRLRITFTANVKFKLRIPKNKK